MKLKIKNKYKRLMILFFVLSFLFIKNTSYATELCSKTGYTILTINGIWTDDSGAQKNRDKLARDIGDFYNSQPVIVGYLLNAPHLGGALDLADAIAQGDFNQKDDYDLTDILTDASYKIKTQKVLVVGHSQGNFYANNFYDKATQPSSGIPKESIGVFSIATPANHVAGVIGTPNKNNYLNSDTDNVIYGFTGLFITNKLPANTYITEVRSFINPSAGHDLIDVYLKYRSKEIVDGIQASLGNLQNNNIQNVKSPCMNPPALTEAYKIQMVTLSIFDHPGDALHNGVAYDANIAYQSSLALGNTVINIASSTFSNISSFAQSIFGGSNNLAMNNLAGVINSENPGTNSGNNSGADTSQNNADTNSQTQTLGVNNNSSPKVTNTKNILADANIPGTDNGVGVSNSSDAFFSDAPVDVMTVQTPEQNNLNTSPDKNKNPYPNLLPGGGGAAAQNTFSSDGNNSGNSGGENTGTNSGQNNDPANPPPSDPNNSGSNNPPPPNPPQNNINKTFLSDGSLRENIILNCNPDGTDTLMMYYITDTGEYHFMNGGNSGIACPDGHRIFMSKGQKFSDYSGYNENVGWYYVAIFSSGTLNCSSFPDPSCVPNKPFDFFRLHRNIRGHWSMSDIPPHDSVPTITTLPQTTNKDTILISGSAVPGSVTITGGSSAIIGQVVNGNYSVEVPLNQNTINDLAVFSTDVNNVSSSENNILINHDNTPPVIKSLTFVSSVGTVIPGGNILLNIVADGTGYTAGPISINGIPAENFTANADVYNVNHKVSVGEPDVSAGIITASVVLTDQAGNSNTAYTNVSPNSFMISGQITNAPKQISPAHDNLGKFTENVALPCVKDSGFLQMYYVKDSDSTFHFMNVPSSNTAACADGNQNFISAGAGLEDFAGYAPVTGWYYGIVSIGSLKCDETKNGQVCNTDNIQSFFRLHRGEDGSWSDSDVPGNIPLSIKSFSLNGSTSDLSLDPTTTPVNIILSANRNVNWLSIKIENRDDISIYKIFQSGNNCVDGSDTCAKTWDGTLSKGGLIQNGSVYRIKVHMQDSANNIYEDYLPATITVNIPPVPESI